MKNQLTITAIRAVSLMLLLSMTHFSCTDPHVEEARPETELLDLNAYVTQINQNQIEFYDMLEEEGIDNFTSLENQQKLEAALRDRNIQFSFEAIQSDELISMGRTEYAYLGDYYQQMEATHRNASAGELHQFMLNEIKRLNTSSSSGYTEEERINLIVALSSTVLSMQFVSKNASFFDAPEDYQDVPENARSGFDVFGCMKTGVTVGGIMGGLVGGALGWAATLPGGPLAAYGAVKGAGFGASIGAIGIGTVAAYGCVLYAQFANDFYVEQPCTESIVECMGRPTVDRVIRLGQ